MISVPTPSFSKSDSTIFGTNNTGQLKVASTAAGDLNITHIFQYPPAPSVTPQNAVMINATIVSSVGVKNVSLQYTGNASSVTTAMSPLGQSTWTGTIPAFPFGTLVIYSIIAEDNANNTVTSEQLGYDLGYFVFPEFPELLIIPVFMLATLVTAAISRMRKRVP
jgi:hypothetical protein